MCRADSRQHAASVLLSGRLAMALAFVKACIAVLAAALRKAERVRQHLAHFIHQSYFRGLDCQQDKQAASGPSLGAATQAPHLLLELLDGRIEVDAVLLAGHRWLLT